MIVTALIAATVVILLTVGTEGTLQNLLKNINAQILMHPPGQCLLPTPQPFGPLGGCIITYG